jgi:hypothetical protein
MEVLSPLNIFFFFDKLKYVFIVFNFKFGKFVKIYKISINILKYALSCKIYQMCKNKYIQILDLISWHRETNLFHTLLYLTIVKKSMQKLEVPKPNNYIILNESYSIITLVVAIFGKYQFIYQFLM